jgi:hypothetical protein
MFVLNPKDNRFAGYAVAALQLMHQIKYKAA